MIGNFEDIEQMAREWSAFSMDVNGWSSQSYEVQGLKVWCYFSADGQHKAVDFNFSRGVEIQVSFHNPTQCSKITRLTLENLHKIVIAAEDGLKLLRDEHAIITEEYKQSVRQQEIENLRSRLAELEGA